MIKTKLLICNGNERKQKLLMEINNGNDLLILFNKFSRIKKIDSLINAINKFQNYSTSNFYEILLPLIIKWSMEYETNELTLMEKGSPSEMTFTAKESRYWLANTFIMNTDRYHVSNYGELSFVELYNGTSLGEEKLLCILCYFYQAMHLDENRHISFHRYIIENSQIISNPEKKNRFKYCNNSHK